MSDEPIDGQLFDAAKNFDVDTLSAVLDREPEKVHACARP